MTEIQKRFQYRKPGTASLLKLKVLRKMCQHIAAYIEEQIPECRERSTAISKLEEVSMWANKAIVFTDPESETPDEV